MFLARVGFRAARSGQDLEQDKIDVTRATPVSGTGTTAKRRGAPLWLQIFLSLVVIAIAIGVGALFNPTANALVKRIGITLPMLNAPADAQAQTQTAAAPAQGGQGGQAAAQGQGAGQRQGQGQGGGQGNAGRAGGFGGNRSAIVVTQPVKTGTINNTLTSIGESSAIHAVTVSSAAGGTLVSVDVKPGDKVEAGAKLATLDHDTQQNAFDKAKLASEDADQTLARTQTLAKTNSVAQTALDAAQLASDSAKLAVQAAQIALDQRTITTPVAGTVGLIQVTPGNLINAQTVVTTVEDSSQILINFWVPERYSGQMVVGTPVAGTSAALPGKTFNGTITRGRQQDRSGQPHAAGAGDAAQRRWRHQIRHVVLDRHDLPGRDFPGGRSAVDPVVDHRRLCLEGRRQQGRQRHGRDHAAQFGRRAGQGRRQGRRRRGDAGRAAARRQHAGPPARSAGAAGANGAGQGQGQGGQGAAPASGQAPAQASGNGGQPAASAPAGQGQQGQGNGQGYKKRQGQGGQGQASSAPAANG